MYLIDNQVVVSNSFLSFLKKVNFIEDITNDEIITVNENNQNAELKNIEIICQKTTDILSLWRINLEQEIKGIASKSTSKTPEVAFLILEKGKKEDTFNLSIIFVELKTTIKPTPTKEKTPKPSTLQNCLEKFESGINRMYMLFSLIDFPEKSFVDKKIRIDFKGVVFYTKDDYGLTDLLEKETKMFKIFKAKNTDNNLVTCESILNDKEKIKIAFYQKTSIKLTELMKM